MWLCYRKAPHVRGYRKLVCHQASNDVRDRGHLAFVGLLTMGLVSQLTVTVENHDIGCVGLELIRLGNMAFPVQEDPEFLFLEGISP